MPVSKYVGHMLEIDRDEQNFEEMVFDIDTCNLG